MRALPAALDGASSVMDVGASFADVGAGGGGSGMWTRLEERLERVEEGNELTAAAATAANAAALCAAVCAKLAAVAASAPSKPLTEWALSSSERVETVPLGVRIEAGFGESPFATRSLVLGGSARGESALVARTGPAFDAAASPCATIRPAFDSVEASALALGGAKTSESAQDIPADGVPLLVPWTSGASPVADGGGARRLPGGTTSFFVALAAVGRR